MKIRIIAVVMLTWSFYALSQGVAVRSTNGIIFDAAIILRSVDGSVTNVSISKAGVVAPLFTGSGNFTNPVLTFPIYFQRQDTGTNLIYRIPLYEPSTGRTGDWSMWQTWYTNVGSGDNSKQLTWGFNYDPTKSGGQASSNEFTHVWSMETWWDPNAPAGSVRRVELYQNIVAPSNAVSYRTGDNESYSYNYSDNVLDLHKVIPFDRVEISGKDGVNDAAFRFAATPGTNAGGDLTVRGRITAGTNSVAAGVIAAYGGFDAFNPSGSSYSELRVDSSGNSHIEAFSGALGKTMNVTGYTSLTAPTNLFVGTSTYGFSNRTARATELIIGGGDPNEKITVYDTDPAVHLQNVQGESMKLQVLASGGGFRMRDDSGNNVAFVDRGRQWGLGNSSPQDRLDVTGNIRASDSVFVTNNIWVGSDVSALTFTDRSKAPASLKDAYEIVASMKSKGGHVDHTALSPLAWGTRTRTVTNTAPRFVKGIRQMSPQIGTVIEPDQSKRDLGMVISAQAMVIQDLMLRIEQLEKKQ